MRYDVKKEINQVIQDKTLTKQEKIQKIKDILKEYPSFCSIVKRRERVQKSMNEDAVKAAVFIADHSEK